jgi:uncharacterized protein with HEPN domain
VDFWLARIIQCSQRLASHIEGYDPKGFVLDQRTFDAACWCISCIGEAVGKVLEAEPEFGSAVQRRELMSAYQARNRYVHGYFSLDELQVWDTASQSVPKIALMAREGLASAGRPNPD